MTDLKQFIRAVPDFPKPGIMFRDVTTLLRNGSALLQAVHALSAPFLHDDVNLVVGVEARGFLFGAAVACRLGAGFSPVRKRGKLPAATIEKSYELEYGTDTLAMHRDAVLPGQRVLMVDDLLATGGTMAATCDMVQELGGEIVGCSFLIELSFLSGRKKLPACRIVSLIDYDSE